MNERRRVEEIARLAADAAMAAEPGLIPEPVADFLRVRTLEDLVAVVEAYTGSPVPAVRGGEQVRLFGIPVRISSRVAPGEIVLVGARGYRA